MKTNKKLALIAALTAPIFASAQLIDISAPETATEATPSLFHSLITDMYNDRFALYTPEGDPDLSLLNMIHFDTTSKQWGVGHAVGAINLQEITVTPFFKLTGRMNIGYVGNESEDNNEFYVAAYSDALMSSTDTDDTNVGGVVGNNYSATEGYKLFDYDADDPGSTIPIDQAPVSYSISLQGQTQTAFVQFTHWNRNPNWPALTIQTDGDRFKFWAVLNDQQEQTGEFLIAISDRQTLFDSDRDDGFFFIDGDVTAVPEPSQIAALALLGLFGALLIRRRFKK